MQFYVSILTKYVLFNYYIAPAWFGLTKIEDSMNKSVEFWKSAEGTRPRLIEW